ncbi:MAG: hypothetical protein P9L97_00630 [Candidatus Tenebribacter davisii]|nr:hypothetical protein [Candidatus Tenebribacter davisii]
MFEELLTNVFYEYTSIYLFSALLQANAAILAIVGVFGIFKIQSIQNKIDFLKNGMTDPILIGGLHADDVEKFEKMPYEELWIQISKISNSVVKSLFTNYMEYKQQIIYNKQIILNSTKILGFGVLIDALCLIFSKIIHTSSSLLEFCLVMFIFIFHIFIIIYTVKSINKLIGAA